jgi:hypothetical protein
MKNQFKHRNSSLNLQNVYSKRQRNAKDAFKTQSAELVISSRKKKLKLQQPKQQI